MHETHLLNEILIIVKQYLKDKEVKEVKRIKMKIGALKMVTPEGLQETFKILPKDKCFNTTKLEVEIVPSTELIIEEVEIVE